MSQIKARIKGFFASMSIAIGLSIIIIRIYFSRNKENGRKARMICRYFYALNGFRIHKIGEFDTSADLVVMNHQSLNDIIFLESFHPRNICWVAKKELGEIPWFGLALTLTEMILIDREDRHSVVHLLREAKIKLAQNRPLVIFPEGTRGRGDEKLLKFKSGAKILAEKFNLKIQPILLINSRRMYESMKSYTKDARLVCLDAYKPDFSDEHWYEKLETLMGRTYAKHYYEMNPEEKSIK